MITLRLTGLAAGRGSRIVVPAFDIALTAGDALLVTGPNGAGKSTLLRTLAGLLPPLAGHVFVAGAAAADGEPVRRLADAAHYLGHRNALKAGRTVADELTFWRQFLGGGGLSTAQALAAVGLAGIEALPAGYLSAGQQRRVAMARLLVADRPVWILDEPTTALDAEAQARFSALCRQRQASGGIVIVATHQPLDLCDARELRLEAPPSVHAPIAEAEMVDAAGTWDELW